MDLLRAALVGAPGTPYHDGLFFFDIMLPPQYPHEPPVSFTALTSLSLSFAFKCVSWDQLEFCFLPIPILSTIMWSQDATHCSKLICGLKQMTFANSFLLSMNTDGTLSFRRDATES